MFSLVLLLEFKVLEFVLKLGAFLVSNISLRIFMLKILSIFGI